MIKFNSICVFCGSADHLNQEYLNSARQVGQLLAQEKINLVFGGGRTGLMGSVAAGMSGSWRSCGGCDHT